MLTISNPDTFNWSSMPLVDCAEGNAMDSYFTLKLFKFLKSKIEKERPELLTLLVNVINPSLELFSKSEYKGIDVDPNELHKNNKDLNLLIREIEDVIYNLDSVGKTDNLNSTAHLAEIMFTREEGLGLYPTEFTDGGSPSTNVEALKLLLDYVNEEIQKRG